MMFKTQTTKKINRRELREFVFQAVYEWQAWQNIAQAPTKNELVTRIENTYIKPFWRATDKMFFQILFKGTIENQTELDGQLHPFLGMEVSSVSLVELAILRIGAYELIFGPSISSQPGEPIPYKVVINEAIVLTKKFGTAPESYKFVNGVLHALAAHRKQSQN